MGRKSAPGSDIKEGLEGVIVAESKICKIDGIKGKLYYRGYMIDDIAKGSFEEAAYLLIYQKLPNRKELGLFSKRLKRERNLPAHIVKLMGTFPKSTTTTEALRTTVSALAAGDPDVNKVSAVNHINNGISLIAKFPTIVAYYYRIKRGLTPIKPNSRLGHAANFLYMINGKVPTETEEKAIDMDFVLHAEHGFNASAFAARVTISTLSDMHSAFTTGIGTLKGPIHGGAATETMRMMMRIGKSSNVSRYVKATLAKHGKIMGFGHRIYRTYDPRARVLNKMAKEISSIHNNMRWYDIAQALEKVMAAEKNLYPNVDFYSSIVYHELGMPNDLDTPIFAIARSAGWVAHCIEQYQNNRLIRPIEKYTGMLDLKYVPLKKRK
ncbi:MAG: citrate/2-methylcitrate synthase [Candidatus Micrarchaeaceae archaeon]